MNTICQEKKWFVLYTRPKYEKKIAQEISEMQYENYLPLRTSFRKWSDRVKRIQEPLFPNYVFVKISYTEKYKVLSADGVVRFVSCEGKPVPVKDVDIMKIKTIETADQDIALEGVSCVGEKVKVIQGVFIGMEGELIRRPRGARLMIRLPVLNQAVSVEIPFNWVERMA